MNNQIIKAILLAGGEGTRLHPMTLVTNKHLLPIYNKPMIYYPLQTVLNTGIKDILIITGKEHAGDFIELLGDGSQFNANFTYRVQEKANGIAGALKLGKNFVNNESILVILGDNIFENELNKCNIFEKGAKIFLKEVIDPTRFGVPTIINNKITKITEKPQNPDSNYCVTGLYIYDSQVWNIIDNFKPSNRGELEITDINNWYIEKEQIKYEIIKGEWIDAGTPDSLLKANNFIKNNINYQNH